MSNDEKLMKQALEALRFGLHVGFDESSESQIKKSGKAFDQHSKAITALCDRLAQPEQEPVATLLLQAKQNYERNFGPSAAADWIYSDLLDLLDTAPTQRKPLTDEEIETCRQQGYDHSGLSASFDFVKAARAIEAAHGIKGEA